VRHKGAFLGVYVAPAGRGQGAGGRYYARRSAQVRALPGLEQIALSMVKENAAALRLYRALGFVEYGLERRALHVGNRYYDETPLALKL